MTNTVRSKWGSHPKFRSFMSVLRRVFIGNRSVPVDLIAEREFARQIFGAASRVLGLVSVVSVAGLIVKILTFFRGDWSSTAAVLERLSIANATAAFVTIFAISIANIVLIFALHATTSPKISLQVRVNVGTVLGASLLVLLLIIPIIYVIGIILAYWLLNAMEALASSRPSEVIPDLQTWARNNISNPDVELNELANRVTQLGQRVDIKELTVLVAGRLRALEQPSFYLAFRHFMLPQVFILVSIFLAVSLPLSGSYIVNIQGDMKSGQVVIGNADAIFIDEKERFARVISFKDLKDRRLCSNASESFWFRPVGKDRANALRCS